MKRGEIGAASYGLVLFRALGGRFRSVAPSALHMPGAFGRRVFCEPDRVIYQGFELS